MGSTLWIGGAVVNASRIDCRAGTDGQLHPSALVRRRANNGGWQSDKGSCAIDHAIGDGFPAVVAQCLAVVDDHPPVTSRRADPWTLIRGQVEARPL